LILTGSILDVKINIEALALVSYKKWFSTCGWLPRTLWCWILLARSIF